MSVGLRASPRWRDRQVACTAPRDKEPDIALATGTRFPWAGHPGSGVIGKDFVRNEHRPDEVPSVLWVTSARACTQAYLHHSSPWLGLGLREG